MRLQSRRFALRSAARRLARLCWLAVLFVALGEAAGASEAGDESQRWAPSFALFFDILGQKGEGTVTTSDVLGPPLPEGCTGAQPRPGRLCDTARVIPPQVQLGPHDRGSDTSVVPLVGGSFELMTPSLIGDRFLRPRLFAHGDFASAFAHERNLAGQGGVDDFALPKGLTSQIVDIDEIAIAGQGTRTRMQVRRWVYSAGAGLALALEIGDRSLRLKPSFEYLREEMDYMGIARRAVKLFTPSGQDLNSFRLISLNATTRESYDGIGGGLELEVDAARLGPFVSSVYLMGRGYYLSGDREISMFAVNEFGESAAWTAEIEPYVWRSGVGFRLRWSPEID